MGSCLALLAAWSLATPPAGSLAYVSAASGQSGRIVVVDVAPGRPEPSERASVATSGEIGELTFSPKRDRVAFTCDLGDDGPLGPPDADFQVWLLDLSSQSASAITKGENGWLGLSWAPDGRSLGAIYGTEPGGDRASVEAWLYRLPREGAPLRLRRIEGEVPRRTAVLADGRVAYRSEKGRFLAAIGPDRSDTLMTDTQMGASDWRLSAVGKTAMDADTFVLQALGSTRGVLWELPSGFRFDLTRGGSNLAVSADGRRYLAWARDLTARHTLVASGEFGKRVGKTTSLDGRWEPLGVSNDGEWMVAKPGTVSDGVTVVAFHLPSGEVVPYLRGSDRVGKATWIEASP